MNALDEIRENNVPYDGGGNVTRRVFARQCLIGSACAVLADTCGKSISSAATEQLPAKLDSSTVQKDILPSGRIAGMKVSRLILGENLFGGGHNHSMTSISKLARAYNTESKILETLQLAETHGINTIMHLHHGGGSLHVLNKHNANGGKIQHIVGVTASIDDPVAYEEQAKVLFNDYGIEAAYVFGVSAEACINKGKPELIGRAIEIIKKAGLAAGISAHSLSVVKECEQRNYGTEFYIKTLHHNRYASAPRPGEQGSLTSNSEYGAYDNSWCRNPDETIAYMATIKTPWVAFKVLAAGMIRPDNGFRYAFENGSDFLLVGMFDFQVAENVQTVRMILADLPKRTRPWMG